MNRGTSTFDVELSVVVASEGGNEGGDATDGRKITFNISGAGDDKAYENVNLYNEWLYAGMDPSDYEVELSSNTLVYTGDLKEFYVLPKEGYQVTVTSPTEGVGNYSTEACPNGHYRLYDGYYFINPNQTFYEMKMKTDVDAVFNIVVTGGDTGDNKGPEVTVNFNIYDKDLSNDDTDVPVEGAVSNVKFLDQDVDVTDNTAIIYLGENYTAQNLTALIAKEGYYIDTQSVTATYKAGFMDASTSASITEGGELSVEIPVLDSGKEVTIHVGLTKNDPNAAVEYTANVTYEGIENAYQYVTYSTTEGGEYTAAQSAKETFTFAPEEALEVSFKAAEGYVIKSITTTSTEEECNILNEAAGETASDDVLYTGSIKEADGVFTLSLDGNGVNNGIQVSVVIEKKILPEITVNFNVYDIDLSDEDTDVPVEGAVSNVKFLDQDIELTGNKAIIYLSEDYTPQDLTAIIAKDGYYVNPQTVIATYKAGFMQANTKATITEDGELSVEIPVLDSGKEVTVYVGLTKNNPNETPVYTASVTYTGEEIEDAYKYVTYTTAEGGEYTAAQNATESFTFAPEETLEVSFKAADGYAIKSIATTSTEEECIILNEAAGETASDDVLYTGSIKEADGVFTLSLDGNGVNNGIQVTVNLQKKNPTSIDSIETSEAENVAVIYNLNGIRVNNSGNHAKGVYIVNGKKVVVK
ncbi:MAG: hypothetical protein J1E57_10225 [Prevotella sp.]|nr:hypothetical protein [Prevotella sp.]